MTYPVVLMPILPAISLRPG